jgi:leucine-rich repeat transmembrane neuronal protein 1/2
MMKDGEKIVLGRTDKYGGGTTIVIWDLLGNEPVRKLKLDASIGFADHISYLNLSHDNRYVVAGFQNSYDGNANFIIFDLTVDDYTNVDPVMLALDADAEATAMLDNHEAVTGTRKGELTIWSLRTGKALRQFVSPSGGVHTLSRGGALTTPAHTGEVKAITISDDGQYLVSASADTTLKIWELPTEKHLFTLRGHTDEVK